MYIYIYIYVYMYMYMYLYTYMYVYMYIYCFPVLGGRDGRACEILRIIISTNTADLHFNVEMTGQLAKHCGSLLQR